MVEDTDSKDGQLRNNLLGKRTEQSGRTVIGPDPTLKMGQIAVPHEMADNLTVPVKVAAFNIEELTKLVNSGRANYVLKNGGKNRINLKYALFRKGTELLHGDEIYREGKKIVVTTGKEVLVKGDRIRRNGKFLDEVKYPEKKNYKLELGDVVERKLIDGDWLLLNRQPGICWKIQQC